MGEVFLFFFYSRLFLIDVQIRLWLSKSNYSFKRKYAYIMLFSYQIVLCVIKLHIWVVLIMKRSMFNKFQRRKCKFIKKRELIISVSYKIHRECCIGFFLRINAVMVLNKRRTLICPLIEDGNLSSMTSDRLRGKRGYSNA